MTYKLNISYLIVILFLLLSSLPSQTLFSQTPSQITNLPSDQIKGLVSKARSQGYTDDQIKALAKTKGLTASQIAELESRMAGSTDVNIQENDELLLDDSETSTNKPTGTGSRTTSNDPLFGYDFFNNPNISFQPNTNLTTPTNYQLGPGDGLVVSLWGAAENSYTLEINRNGFVKIPNIGPVFVSGMDFENASQKIETSLKKVYAGIGAPTSSSYKIFTDISLSKVRTVQVNIIGQVKVPGTYSLSALSTVLNALYACGGPSKQGTFRAVKLIRDGQEVSNFDVYKYLTKGSQDGNETVQDQDLIIVGPYISRISIDGEVKRPGIYEIKPSESLQDLLNYVGGLTSNAYREKIKLVRVDGDRRKLKEISFSKFKSEPLFDGDVINVGSILGGITNTVTISGAVLRPGDYEYTPSLTIKQLINKASGINPSAYLKRGLLSRTVDTITKDIASFSVEDILNDKEVIELSPGDLVTIFNQSVVKTQGKISISGAVNQEKSIPFVENITLEELVILANGFKKQANTTVIDVTREVIDDDYNTINKIFKISADGKLDMNTDTAFKFEPNDKVIVRYLVGSFDQQYSFIEGEVNYPGQYFSEKKNERVLDLINRSGGLSPYAFIEGATLIRQNPFFNEKAVSLTKADVNEDNTVEEDPNIDLNNKKEFRIGIDLNTLLEQGENSKHNLVLKTGDRLLIPSVKQTVKVEGEVFLPALIRFDKGENLKDYINKSGGFSKQAKKGKVYVIHPNGDIAATKHFLFFRSFPDIKPGSIVLVPKKQERTNGISAQEVIGTTTAAATLFLLIQQITN